MIEKNIFTSKLSKFDKELNKKIDKEMNKLNKITKKSGNVYSPYNPFDYIDEQAKLKSEEKRIEVKSRYGLFNKKTMSKTIKRPSPPPCPPCKTPKSYDDVELDRAIDMIKSTDFTKEYTYPKLQELNDVLDSKQRNGRIYTDGYIREKLSDRIAGFYKNKLNKTDIANYILYNNKPISLDEFTISNRTIDISKRGVVCNFHNIHDLNIIATEHCTFITGDRCSFVTSKNCKFIIGDDCEFLFNDKKDCIIIGNDNKIVETNNVMNLGFNFDTIINAVEIT